MNGKSKCKILKEIRKQIARENDIEFITSECKYKGDCLGTCPRCEAEVRYLEAELLKRRRQGKNIAVAGLAAALVATSVGCSGDKVHNESSSFSDLSAGGSTLTPTDNSLIEEITGEMVELQGDIAPEYIVDPTSRPEKAEPDSEHFLSLKKSEQLDYIAGFSREELQTAWEDNFSSISNKTHDYYLFFGSVTKRLDVEYGANDKVISVEIIKNYNSHTSYTSSANSSGSNPTKDSSERYTTMGAPRVNTQSSASDTESELEYHATPNLEYFLHLYDGVGFNNSFETWNKPNHYLSHYTRKQIKKAWKDCFVTTVLQMYMMFSARTKSCSYDTIKPTNLSRSE